jgi:BirA family transcriptional regulator, biotin operon repressor / biotin---[acetyl-CoA-carboxylase] ligase
MAFALGRNALLHGYRLSAHDTIGSTNSEALERGRAGDPGRLWVVARAQTAGHGRRGRPWQTPSGNLAASLLLSLPARATQAATLGFAAGLALEGAIRDCAPNVLLRLALDEGYGAGGRVRLKWPNDVLIDGAKVAGILLEAVTVESGRSIVVIGIGVNVRHKPEGATYPATSLAECGADATPEVLFAALAENWVEQEDLWNGGRGFAAIRDRWLDRAAGLGAPIAVRTGEAIFRGTFETIDDEGRLVVRASDGSARTISAGEVHFGAAATVAQ